MIVGGALILAREEFTPVRTCTQKETFPAGSSIPLAGGQPTLVVFVHPLCPCTRASFHELEELRADVKSSVSLVIVFTVADGLASDWEKGDLWQSAQALSDVQVIVDRGGAEARRFQVAGSGHCLLYAPTGALLFSGGITASRGHEGENPGRLALVSFIRTGQAPVHHTPVFGCSLL